MASSLKDLANRLYNAFLSFRPPPDPQSSSVADRPLRLGILGAANIAPIAVILPSRSHPDVIVSAVAARSKAKAQAFAQKHSIPHVFDDYLSLINDSGIDVVYNPLPNGLHYKWTLEAIKAGKHVLLEKPCTSNAEQAREIFQQAKDRNVLVLEAFHYRFHPALHEFAYQLHCILSPINPLVNVEASLFVPSFLFKEADIRFNWKLAGGSLMDTGCYTVSSLLYTMRCAAGTWKRQDWQSQIEVQDASPTCFVPDSKVLREEQNVHLDHSGNLAIDTAMNATLLVPTARNVKLPCKLETGLEDHFFTLPILGWKVPRIRFPSIKATFKDGTTVEYTNFAAPSFWHRIRVTYRGRSAQEKKLQDGDVQDFKAYVPSGQSDSEKMKRACKDGYWSSTVGQEWWTTYRYQLEAFVQGVRAVQAGTPAAQVGRWDLTGQERDQTTPHAPVWVDNEESITIMNCVDAIYERTGLGKRL